jgi:hypothetical protein
VRTVLYVVLFENRFMLFEIWYLMWSCTIVGSGLIAVSASRAKVLIQFLNL